MNTNQDRHDPFSRFAAEWRRTGMPGEPEREPDGSASVWVEPWGTRVTIAAPLAVAAVLEHLPSARAPEDLLLGVLRRLLVEPAPEGDDVADWRVVLEVLRARAVAVVRHESQAIHALFTASKRRAHFDAYVAELKNFETAVANDDFDVGARSREARADSARDPQLLRPDLEDALAVLVRAEFVRRAAGSGTAGFWDVLCDELAAGIRAALADGAPRPVSAPGTGEPSRCLYCGADLEIENAGMCPECANAALLRRSALDTVAGQSADPHVSCLFDFVEAAGKLALAAARVAANATTIEGEFRVGLVPMADLRALRAALPEFARLSGNVPHHLRTIASERATRPNREVPRA